MTIKLWHLCNFSAGPAHFPGGFSSDVLREGPNAWAICAEQVMEQVPEVEGIILHNPHGCYPTATGHMQMLFEQRSRARAGRLTKRMASESQIIQAIADVRSIMGYFGVKAYLGYPRVNLSEDEFINEMFLWASLGMPIYIDGNALPPRADQHAWMQDRYFQMSRCYLGVEAVPDKGSRQDNYKTPMFYNARILDSAGRENPGMMCHRGTQLRYADGKIVDGTLEDAVRRCKESGHDLCINLNPQTDESRADLELVRGLIRGGNEQ